MNGQFSLALPSFLTRLPSFSPLPVFSLFESQCTSVLLLFRLRVIRQSAKYEAFFGWVWCGCCGQIGGCPLKCLAQAVLVIQCAVSVGIVCLNVFRPNVSGFMGEMSVVLLSEGSVVGQLQVWVCVRRLVRVVVAVLLSD